MKYLIAAIVALGIAYGCWPDPHGDAWDRVKPAVLAKIKTPATAVFGPAIFHDEPDAIVVTGYFDAENLYGATVRERFEAIVSDDAVAVFFESEAARARQTFKNVATMLQK